ncbi:Mig-14 family protein [Edwardsiella hoshinae]|uniref:Mig-14 family protein n=1 Tax=Edwardsiella hoshinae TaxID=93378 RepID=A0ABN4SSC3_9GAMM|nr:GNAT family N-acetyltransferase [Edwardsiella hoshinae]AOV95520.1 Mig-14 family protein [Edwardsiella hoshinae]
MFIKKLLGWRQCDFASYKMAAQRYGYSAESAPDYIEFMLDCGATFNFIAYYHGGEIVAVACIDNGWLVNDFKNNNKSIVGLPLPVSGIVLPMKRGTLCCVPFKSRCISGDYPHVLNITQKFSKRLEAVAKKISDFSKKTQQTRRREIKKFQQAGGDFIDIATLSADTLLDSYDALLKKRWGQGIANLELNRQFFRRFQHCFYGDVAMLNGEIVGIQLLLKTESVRGIFVDFINIGYDVDNDYPLGTMLMWRNIERVAELGDGVKYSYGFMSGEYKKRWCTPQLLSRVIF